MKRLSPVFSVIAALLLPLAATAQEQPAGKRAEENPQAAPAGEAAKPSGEPKDAVKSAAFADVDLDGHIDLVLGYDLAENLDLQATGAAEAGAYIRLVAKIDDGGIGASLTPASDTLRAQLKLAEGQGLVVTSVNADSPAAKAGLQVDDILLSAGDRPLAKPSDVSDIVNSPVKKPFTVEFTVLRAGERRKVPLTVTDGAITPLVKHFAIRLAEPSYRIGVEVSDASSTLRAQLKLPKDQGIVIDRVLPDSPAQKAGFKEHDVLLTVDGKPLAKSEDLSAAVKASEGKSLKFSLLRGGQRSEIGVTPEKRNEGAYRVRTTRASAYDALLHVQSAKQAQERAVLTELVARRRLPSGDTAAQIERMLKQIDDLRDAVKALQSTVEKQKSAAKPPKTDQPGKGEEPKK